MKKLKAENPCNMDLNSRGGGVWSMCRSIYNGRNIAVINNYRRCRRDNTAISHR